MLHVRLLSSANQSERYFQSDFSGNTIFTFHFNEEHVLFRNNRLFVIDPSDVCGTNQIESQLLVSSATLVKGLCRGTISQYLDL